MRYAIYFTPAAHHPLTAAAARWLGRNAFDGTTFSSPDADGQSAEEVQALTAQPRRYGFHATLKAPFELAEGQSEAELVAALQVFASSTSAFQLPAVIVSQLGPFFALVPAAVYPELQAFAARVVEEFEPMRAPLSDADLARRKPETLKPEHRANLERWGYPYVMEEFRFHMTLTGPVPAERAPAIERTLHQRFQPFIRKPLAIDSIALFVEPARGEPFVVRHWFPLVPPSGKSQKP